MTTVREAAFDLFRARGMTTMFGNPGSTELPMLHSYPDDFEYVLGLQEAVVVGMADGYAQASGKPTLVNLHTAPGVGNAVGAMFNAQANKSPLVITAGQQVRAMMTLQANLTNRDAIRVPDPFVKWSYEPPRAEDVPLALARAVHVSTLPPKGPSFVSIPMDDWTRRGGRRRRRACDRALRERKGDGRSGADRVAGGSPREGEEPGDGCRSRRRRERAPGTPRSPSPSASACRCGRRPAPGGGRIGFPEGHPNFRGTLPPAIGPLGQMLEGHDLVLTLGASVFPYYPNIPGPLLPEGTELVAITSDPDEAARAPMGDAIVADVELTLEALLEAVPESDREAPEPLGEPPGAAEESDPLQPLDAVHAALGRRLPRRRHRGARVAVEHDGAPQPAAALAPGQLLLRRRRRAGLRPRGRGRRPARPARPARSCA